MSVEHLTWDSWETTQPSLIFPTSQPNAAFWRCAPTGAMTLKFKLGRDFCNCTYPQVLSSYIWKLSCWQINTQTNRRRWKHPTLFATLRRLVMSCHAGLSVCLSVWCIHSQAVVSSIIHSMLTDRCPLCGWLHGCSSTQCTTCIAVTRYSTNSLWPATKPSHWGQGSWPLGVLNSEDPSLSKIPKLPSKLDIYRYCSSS